MSEGEGRIFEQERFVHIHDCDETLRITVQGILCYFEEVAFLQSDSLGVGFAWYHENKVGWILTNWDVRIHSVPRFRHTVTVRTQPLMYRSFTASRGFRITGEDGEVHVEADSQWIFVDAERMRPKRIPPEIPPIYEMPESEGRLSWKAETAPPEREDHAIEFRVRGHDLDYNGHVNNRRYVDWALETVPGERIGRRRLTRLVASYRGETKGDADVRSVAQVDEVDGEVSVRHAISEGDRVACLMETRWG